MEVINKNMITVAASAARATESALGALVWQMADGVCATGFWRTRHRQRVGADAGHVQLLFCAFHSAHGENRIRIE